MIRDHDRSGYIGASDTDRVVCSWSTKTFERWWMEKLGFERRDFQSDAMKTGTALEHRILESLNIPGMRLDEQRIIGRLRVNLDGYDGETIYECKTYRYDPQKPWKPPKSYIRQVYVQAFVFGAKKAYVVGYGLCSEEYRNWFLPCAPERSMMCSVGFGEEYDAFLAIYVPRLVYLSRCLERGEWPTEEKFALWAGEQKKY